MNLSKIKNIEYKKLIITFFAHLWVALLYGSFFAVMIIEYGFPLWFGISIQVATVFLVTYVAYQEEIRRHYPFLKAVGVNLLGFLLWLGIAFTKIYILNVLALFIVLLAIRYKCRQCIEFKRYEIG